MENSKAYSLRVRVDDESGDEFSQWEGVQIYGAVCMPLREAQKA